MFPGGRFLAFHDKYIGTKEKPGRIVKEYHKTATSLKNKIYGSNANKEHIDHHKITALYILSFLKYKPFYLDIPNETKKPKECWHVKLANEYFSLPFMEAVFKANNKTTKKELQIEENYKKDFIKMLFEHKENITKLEPLAFADTIYHIEQRYFLSS
jgi:hypothetical protein